MQLADLNQERSTETDLVESSARNGRYIKYPPVPNPRRCLSPCICCEDALHEVSLHLGYRLNQLAAREVGSMRPHVHAVVDGTDPACASTPRRLVVS